MTITTTTNQAECLAVLLELGVFAVFQPRPPQVVSDSILQLDDDTWIVGTNDRGRYTLYLLEGATKGRGMASVREHPGAGHEVRFAACGILRQCSEASEQLTRMKTVITCFMFASSSEATARKFDFSL